MRKLVIVLLIFSGVILLLGLLPSRSNHNRFNFQLGRLIEQYSTEPGSEDSFMLEDEIIDQIAQSTLQLDVSLPAKLLTGRKANVMLNAELIDAEGISPYFEPGHEPGIQIRSQLILPRQFVEPAGFSSRELTTGTPVGFRWNMLADKPEAVTGELWVYLDLTERDQVVMEFPLLAKKINVPVEKIMGLNLSQSRIVAMILAGIGFLFILLVKFHPKIRGGLK